MQNICKDKRVNQNVLFQLWLQTTQNSQSLHHQCPQLYLQSLKQHMLTRVCTLAKECRMTTGNGLLSSQTITL